jgi:hypothetical protein
MVFIRVLCNYSWTVDIGIKANAAGISITASSISVRYCSILVQDWGYPYSSAGLDTAWAFLFILVLS